MRRKAQNLQERRTRALKRSIRFVACSSFATSASTLSIRSLICFASDSYAVVNHGGGVVSASRCQAIFSDDQHENMNVRTLINRNLCFCRRLYYTMFPDQSVR